MAVDLFVSYFVEESGERPFFSFGTPTPKVVEGLTKLLIFWLKALFTETGSDIYDEKAGSVFPRLIGTNISDLESVHDLVALSIEQATDTVRRLQSGQDLPVEERIGITQLVSVENDGNDGILAKIHLANGASQSLILSLPLSETRNGA